MKKIFISSCSFLLVLVMLFNITGCRDLSAGNLTDGLARKKAESKTADEKFLDAQFDFAAELFRLCASESGYQNTLISPLSVMTALAMTMNGANGLTEEEMEAVLGGGVSTEELNAYLYAYNENLTEELVLANSIWFRDALHVNEIFLQTNKDYYDAEIYSAPFDRTTVKQINAWVKQNTKEMIPEIIHSIDADTVMMLINALAFEARWTDPYNAYQQKQEIFTSLKGEKQTVTMMHSSESRYLEDKNTTGFLKYYEGGNYAFAALLPDEKTDFANYVNGLDGEKIAALLNNSQAQKVNAAMPKFKNEYDISMVNALKKMGIKQAFDENSANFSDIAPTGLFIGNVLHKTYISVDNLGTKAGAVTAVTLSPTSAAPSSPKEIKTVILDRPFVYMIIDTENNLPVFIGTVTDFS